MKGVRKMSEFATFVSGMAIGSVATLLFLFVVGAVLVGKEKGGDDE